MKICKTCQQNIDLIDVYRLETSDLSKLCNGCLSSLRYKVMEAIQDLKHQIEQEINNL